MPRERANNTGGLIKYANCANFFGQYYTSDGRQRRKSTGTSIKAEAESVLRSWMVDSSRGLKPTPETRGVTYEHLRAGLLDAYRIKSNKSLHTFADGSEGILPLRPLDEFFKGRKANSIDAVAVKGFIKKRQSEGHTATKKPVSNATINNSLSLLRRMFVIACKENKIIQHVPYIPMLKQPAPRTGFVPQKKFNQLLAAMPRHLRPLVTFQYYTAARKGESAAIRWEQADLKAGLVVFEAEQTKTGKPRVIPLPDVLVKMLRKQEPKTGLLFDTTNFRKSWETACDAVGLGKITPLEGKRYYHYEGLNLHDLRRSGLRNLRIAGAAQSVAMKISGHKDPSVYIRYDIVDTVDVRKAMKRVERVAAPTARKTQRLLGESLR